ncbi:type VI secretion system baseplate subunit TssE [Paracoccaceae bacterium GXU_MW_L88]
MSESAQDNRLAASLLDRLLDLEPDLERDPPVLPAEQPAGLRESLRRDLELLLNTRCAPEAPPPGLRDLDDSLLRFGVGDFFSSALVTPAQREAFARDLERRIATFEPRLENLSVTLHEDMIPQRRSLHLRIAAEYRPAPGLPPIRFESRIDPVAGHFAVSEGSRG